LLGTCRVVYMQNEAGIMPIEPLDHSAGLTKLVVK
jgi:hypothetical protein